MLWATFILVPLDRVLHRSAVFTTRSDARSAIAAGRVQIDGVQVHTNEQVNGESKVLLDGTPLPPPPPSILLAMHKPVAVETTMAPSTASGFQTVLELLPSEFKAACARPVGRLDADSEGLLLFTNDGTLAQLALRPGAIEKVYYALTEPRAPTPTGVSATTFAANQLERLANGITFQNGYTGRAERCRVVSGREALRSGANFADDIERRSQRAIVEVVMRQGAKREVRRLLKAVGLRTVRLCRTAVGSISLGDLELDTGCVVPLPHASLRDLYSLVSDDLVRDLPPAYDSETGLWVAAETMAQTARAGDGRCEA